MSLVKCDDCGKEVSPSAVACIHCGRPMGVARVKTKSVSAAIVTIGMLMILSGFLLFAVLVLNEQGPLAFQFGPGLLIAGIFTCIAGRIFS